METKFGSGKYCSRSCANTRHHSAETKTKIGQGVAGSELYKQSNEIKQAKRLTDYYLAPNFCVICGEILPYELRNQTCCSEQCLAEHRSKMIFERVHGFASGKY